MHIILVIRTSISPYERQQLVRRLQRGECEIDVVSQVEDAVQCIAERRVDLVILDAQHLVEIAQNGSPVATLDLQPIPHEMITELETAVAGARTAVESLCNGDGG